MLGRQFTDEDYETYINTENREKSPKNAIKQPKEIAKKPSFSFSEIAKHAAKKARRKIAKRQGDTYRMSKLFGDNTNN